MRLMFLGDRMWGTSGYSRVVYNFCTRLTGRNEIAHIPMNQSMQGGKMNYQGVLIYPSGRDAFGESSAYDSYIDFNADMLITVKEPWVFNHLSGLPINWVPMAIIDHSPASRHITSKIANAFKVIAISQFGQRELKHHQYNPMDSVYIPHGVDTNIYHPLSYEKKQLSRKLWSIPEDEFIVGIVALNRSRKLITRMLRGYRHFVDAYPDIKTHLMLWSNILPQGLDEEHLPGVADVGVDMTEEIMNLKLGELVLWPPDRAITEGIIPEWAGDDYRAGWDMVKLYNSFDVLFHCTGGEGFGLPLIEAQACGVPVLTTDYAAGPELVGSGFVVKSSDYIIISTPGTRYALPDIDAMVDGLKKAYDLDRKKASIRARLFAENYSWENVITNYMNPFLEECQRELRPKVTSGGVDYW